MEVITKRISGLLELQPRVFADSRGYFFESYSAPLFNKLGITDVFVQDNQSYSEEGTLRGLHFQAPPFAQGKLVRVITGKVWDIVVDIRVGSPTYGQWDKVLLDANKNNMFWVPPGFAHGFLTLEPTIFAYKCTNVYDKAAEGGLLWNDPAIGIDWGIDQPLVSDKDLVLPTLAELASPFTYDINQ